MFDQPPVGALTLVPILLKPYQYPAAVQAHAIEREFELTLLECLLRRLATLWRPETAVPELHRTAAVLTLRNRALKIAVVERMVFHLHRQALIGRIERWSARNCPGLEDSVPFQAQVIVQSTCRVLLDDKTQPRGRRDRGGPGF